jgi:C4-type Zn-finger protein
VLTLYIMSDNPLVQRIYHPSCGRSYYYVLIRKRYKREVEGKVVNVKVYMCRACGEEFSDLDILEHENSLPQVDITQMSEEERKTFIEKLCKGMKHDAKPS